MTLAGSHLAWGCGSVSYFVVNSLTFLHISSLGRQSKIVFTPMHNTASAELPPSLKKEFNSELTALRILSAVNSRFIFKDFNGFSHELPTHSRGLVTVLFTTDHLFCD